MVRFVHEGSAASAAGIGCFDELLNINGERVTSAVHAVAMIRDAPNGTLYVRMRCCPVRLSRAAAYGTPLPQRLPPSRFRSCDERRELANTYAFSFFTRGAYIQCQLTIKRT